MSILKSLKYITLSLALMTGSLMQAEKLSRGEKQSLRYARSFEIIDFHTHSIATVRIGSGDSTFSYRYALLPKGTLRPELPEDVTIIRTPIQQVVVLETIYIGFLEALDQMDTIIGAASTDYIVNPNLRKRIEDGTIRKLYTIPKLNIERLLLLEPDLIFTSIPSEPTFNIPAQLARAELPFVVTAEYREHHPLARAEWIKFIAAFFDETEKATELFDAIADRYENLLKKVDTIKNRPDVFCGAPYSSVWHMAGENSYIAQLIQDAGGNYLWKDVNSANTIPLDFERVFLKAANADIWLNPSFYRTRQALFSADLRFKKFRAAQMKTIYNHTRQQKAGLGNPIWESGIMHPDDVLADLIKIFHPDRLLNHEFVYYEKLNDLSK